MAVLCRLPKTDRSDKESYPLPQNDNALDCIAGSTWFSTLDLWTGYWQVELSLEAHPKTAFSISHRLGTSG